MRPLGIPELLLVLALAVLVFGTSRKKRAEIVEAVRSVFDEWERAFRLELSQIDPAALFASIGFLLGGLAGALLMMTFGFESLMGLVGFLLVVSAVFVLLTRSA
jgi:hypothetical protein